MTSPPTSTSTASTSTPSPPTVVAVRPDREILTRQRLPYFVGVSGETTGSRGLSMHMVVIPPGGSAAPHRHRGYETAIYVLEGRVETRYGPGLRERIVSAAGEFLFIPPDVAHQAFNLSDSEPARAIVARNDPAEQENVVPYDPAEDA
ncbi:MAG: cupin domain-containing protein [Casimicrobiaceae bacterium]